MSASTEPGRMRANDGVDSTDMANGDNLAESPAAVEEGKCAGNTELPRAS